MAIVVFLVATVAGAGCTTPDALDSVPQGESFALVPDCEGVGFDSYEDSVCVKRVRAGPGTHFEPHIAAHPIDPDRVLLSSMYVQPGDQLSRTAIRIVAALTQDGGETWPFSILEEVQPESGAPSGTPLAFREGFDAITGFDGAGNPHVLFGGDYNGVGADGLGRAITDWQMTVARSTDDAASWTYHPFHETPLVLEIDDYMDMGIGSDNGDIYVVTDSHGERGEPASHQQWPFTIAFWRSQDGGASWETRALASAPSADDRNFQFPRIAAGTDGFVLVTAQRFDEDGEDYEGISAWISRDRGASFDGPVSISDIRNTGENGQQTTAWHDRLDVVHATAEQGMVAVRSEDEGGTWNEPVVLSEPVAGRQMALWESAVDDTTGDLYALERTADADGTGFYLTLLRWTGTHVDRFPLMEAPDAGDDGVFEGGHYAGLDVALDGSVWVAWADPRVDADPIAVAHLRPAQEPVG